MDYEYGDDFETENDEEKISDLDYDIEQIYETDLKIDDESEGESKKKQEKEKKQKKEKPTKKRKHEVLNNTLYYYCSLNKKWLVAEPLQARLDFKPDKMIDDLSKEFKKTSLK